MYHIFYSSACHYYCMFPFGGELKLFLCETYAPDSVAVGYSREWTAHSCATRRSSSK